VVVGNDKDPVRLYGYAEGLAFALSLSLSLLPPPAPEFLTKLSVAPQPTFTGQGDTGPGGVTSLSWSSRVVLEPATTHSGT